LFEPLKKLQSCNFEDFVKYGACLDAADVNETVCEQQCGGGAMNKSSKAFSSDMQNKTEMLQGMNDMCT
jgi:hypothetical protein